MTTSNELVVEGTPWEVYRVDGVPIHVKREDLSCPSPGPSFSKIRGVAAHIAKIKQDKGIIPIGVLDTVHSKAGWGVSYICNRLGMPCVDFYPVYKHERFEDGAVALVRHNQVMAQKLGAELYSLPAGRSAILYHKAKKMCEDGGGYMMPNALKLKESVRETEKEVINYTPKKLVGGTWVISISSGTIAAGVIRGLAGMKRHSELDVVVHMGYSRSLNAVSKYMHDIGGAWITNTDFVDEGFSYKDKIEYEVPFPCNPYYDLKAWRWTVEEIHTLRQPVIFWNIGA